MLIMLLFSAGFISLHLSLSQRLDGTYIKVKGIWCYLYRAVDKLGNTVDFLLTRKRQRMNAQSFLIKAISNNCRLRVINIDKSGSNTAAIKVYNKRSFSKIKIRQCKDLNNIVEQDHRFIKFRIQNGLGFKSFSSAQCPTGVWWMLLSGFRQRLS
jgi:putative transposase